jgi:capsular polysaccharide biosynthesis protein
MTKNAQISKNLPEDEISLIDILDFFVINKNIILSTISIFTVSSVIYCFSVTPIYKATISFIPSQELHISEPMLKNKLSQIQQPIFRQFIDQMKFPDLLEKIATEGSFLEKFKDGPNDTSDTAQLISKINSSITTSPVYWKNDHNRISPTKVEMTGKNPTVISEFLIALSAAGIETAQNKTSELIQEVILKVTQDLKNSLPKNVMEKRLELLRKKAKALRLEKIKILEDHLKAAKNFTEMEKSYVPLYSSNLMNQMDPFNDFVFLNGEKAIQILINNLKIRTNDDLYSPEISRLKESLEDYKNNQISHQPSEKTSDKLPLRNVKSVRQTNDFDEKTKLIEEKIRNLKKRPEVIIVSKKNFFPQEPNTPEKLKIITYAIISGVFFGIFIAILRSGLIILKRTKSMD